MWLFACSGPGARAVIGYHIDYALRQAMVVCVIAAVSLAIRLVSARRNRYPAACLAILAFHPAWTMSARRGDCGRGMANSAAWATAIASIVVVAQVIHAVVGRVGSRPLVESTGQANPI